MQPSLYAVPPALTAALVLLFAVVLVLLAAAIRRYRRPDPVPMAEGKFRALAESASDAIASVNSRGDITYVNGAAARTPASAGDAWPARSHTRA